MNSIRTFGHSFVIRISSFVIPPAAAALTVEFECRMIMLVPDGTFSSTG
jgi:hypothetical protein